jgi:bifunctional UDP-N-acetylglucosamine pyrophosphorylase / glucosamine-1-phosphate N-acetyltransferase
MAEAPLQVLVLAAGKGTRMRSARAKVLHTAFELPLLSHVLRAARPLAPSPLTVVVGHQAEQVERALSDAGVDFVRQEPQGGTGHAVQAARSAIARFPERPLLVLGGDTPLLRPETLGALVATHHSTGASATLLSFRLDSPGAYGRVVRAADGRVRRIVEAVDATAEERALEEVNAGIYVFDVPALLSALDQLDSHNAQGELYLTDVISKLVSQDRAVSALMAADPQEALGVNTMEELAEAGDALRLRRLKSLMSAGVVIEDVSSVSVGPDASVEADAVLRPFTILEGRSRVASGARVGPFVRLVNCVVEQDAEILDHCLLRDSTIGPGAVIGPFAHIRPDSVVEAKAKVGNFVELKKTRLGEGSKAPHLSYLGDSQIGPRVNVGAGTITCNYDGTHKHPTEIAGGAFIGSHSTLVAPVSIGAGAYVAAGSVITENVPQDALALGRARQVVKPNWARERRERMRREKDQKG